MRRFFRGGCKCLNAKMESQNYLLSFCAGVQEGLLQAYHEQCRSTVIVKTRPIKDIVLYILRDDALVRFTFYLEVESFILPTFFVTL